MKLREHLKGKTVLNIGTNAGFLPLEVADICSSIDALDINPYLIRIAKVSAEFLNIHNVNFWAGTFEDYNENKTYDVVLSFANHSTYDHNTKQTVEDYFKKCHKYIKDGGILLSGAKRRGPRVTPVGELSLSRVLLRKKYNKAR